MRQNPRGSSKRTGGERASNSRNNSSSGDRSDRRSSRNSRGGSGKRGKGNGSGRVRGNGRSITADAEKEAKLLPIEWRCRTPPEQHQEVLDAVARSRRALDSADRVAKTIQLKQQGVSGDGDGVGFQGDNGMQFSPKGRSKGSGFDAYGQPNGRPPRHGVQRANSHGSPRNEVPIIIGDYNDALGDSQTLGRTSFSAPVVAEKQTVNFWGNQPPPYSGNGAKNAPSSASASVKPRQPQPQGYFSPKSSNPPMQAPQNAFNSSAPLSFYPKQQQQQQQQHGGPSAQQNGSWKQNPPNMATPNPNTWGQPQQQMPAAQQSAWQQPPSFYGQQGVSQNSQMSPYPSPQPYSAPQSFSAPSMPYSNPNAYNQQQSFVPPKDQQASSKSQSPNQRRQKSNMQNAGKTIVYQDYRDRNGSGSRSGSAKNRMNMKYGKPTGTPQGAVVISPAQLRAKSLNNSKHVKRRATKKKISPSSGR